MIKKLLIFALVIGVALPVGIGAKPVEATHAASYGYFHEKFQSSGDNVWQPWANTGCGGGSGWALPSSVVDATSFINHVKCRLGRGTQDRVGAAYIISTMIGEKNLNPSAEQIAKFEGRVRYAESRGWINFFARKNCVSGLRNTFYQPTHADIAWYTGCPSVQDSQWGPYYVPAQYDAITFYNGSQEYIIARFCANPIGTLPPLPAAWSMQGTSTASDSNESNVAGPGYVTSKPGEQVTFRHTLRNAGPDQADNIWRHIYRFSGSNSPSVWTAQYYNNTSLSGSPVLTRTEPMISYHDPVGNVAPAPGVVADGFSARWTMTRNFTAGDYQFTMKGDDGVRLKIDGTTVLNAWVSQGATPYTTWRNLSAGNHTIVLEYFEGGGPGWASLDITKDFISGINSGNYTSGQTRTWTNTITIPSSATGGMVFCERMLFDWARSSGIGDSGAGTGAWSDGACAVVEPTNNLSPAITPIVNGVRGVTDLEPGDTLSFEYSVDNQAGHTSSTVTCTYRQVTHTGYSTSPPPASATLTIPGSNCPPSRTFPTGSTVTATEGINTTSLANRSICRSFIVSPGAPDGSDRTAQRCVHIGNKPYFRVFSGDIMAGGGFASAGACSLNSRAAIIGWNRGSAATYAGAGVQYAALAMHQIFEVATSQTTGGAPPAGHSFANNNTSQNSPTNGRYGGHFGGVQCIPDYYGDGPSSPYTNIGTSSISGTLNGTYRRNGNLRIDGATIAANTEATVYVDGNVFISNNITYGGNGNWSVSNIPTFRLLVKGSIFIENDVTQLDGLYVAQPDTDDALSGRIYTCQTASSPYTPLPLDGQLASQCNTKLTINGAFVADQVWLMRTNGTVRQAGASDGPDATHISEVFNLNPAFWISQPGDASSSSGQYDSITSLPPIL